MASKYQDIGVFKLEFFPQAGELGSPGGFAKAAALLGNLLTAAAAAVVAAVVLFFPYIDCTPLYIMPTAATLEAESFNLEPEQEVWWYLIPGPEPEELPENIPEEELKQLLEQLEKLFLDNLQPNSEYTILFLTPGEDGQWEQMHSFTFRTPGDGAQPPPSGEPGEPSVPDPLEPSEETVPTDPTEATSEPTETSDPTEESTEPTESTGGGGGWYIPPATTEPRAEPTEPTKPKPTGPSYLRPEEMNSKNTLTYVDLGNLLEFTFTIKDIEQGAYDLRLTNLEIYVDGELYREITDVNQLPAQKGSSIVYKFVMPRPQKGWMDIELYATGDSFEDTSDVSTAHGNESDTFLVTEVLLDTPYQVGPLNYPTTNNNGFVCNGIFFYKQSTESSSLEAVEGQTINMGISMKRIGTSDPSPFYLKVLVELPEGSKIDPASLDLSDTSGYVGEWYQDYYFTVTFTMPAGDVTKDDIVVRSFQWKETPFE